MPAIYSLTVDLSYGNSLQTNQTASLPPTILFGTESAQKAEGDGGPGGSHEVHIYKQARVATSVFLTWPPSNWGGGEGGLEGIHTDLIQLRG